MVCVVDRDWSGEIANRLRGVGRYHASRTVVCAVEPGADDRRDATVASASEPGARRVRAAARDDRRSTSASSTSRALDTIVDPLVVTDLATVVWSPHGHPEAVDALLRRSRSRCCSTRSTSPTRATALARAARARASARTSSTSPGCARRRGASASPRTSTRRAARPQLGAAQRASPCATARARTVAALLLLGWLSSAAGLGAGGARRATTAALRGTARGRRGGRRAAPRAGRARTCRGLAGVTLETADGDERWRSSAAPGGLAARRRGARRPRARVDRARRLARRGRASSARASARRCCATRPTGPALRVRARRVAA